MALAFPMSQKRDMGHPRGLLERGPKTCATRQNCEWRSEPEVMKIIHRFCLKIRSDFEAGLFTDLGLSLDRDPGDKFAVVRIAEDSPEWFAVQSLVERFRVTEFVTTEFSEPERSSAHVLC